jgi:hypothetical protein
LFVALSAVAWMVFVPVYYMAFAWTEFVPGANWVYLPHGLRMILVLLFGVAGALGFTLGASVLSGTVLASGPLPPPPDVLIALVPALAAWLAVRWTFKDWAGRYLALPRLENLQALDGRRLILAAMISAVLNAAGHAVIWGIWAPEIAPAQQRFLAMWIGDFLGALLLLYTLRGAAMLIVRFSHRPRTYGKSTP